MDDRFGDKANSLRRTVGIGVMEVSRGMSDP